MFPDPTFKLIIPFTTKLKKQDTFLRKSNNGLRIRTEIPHFRAVFHGMGESGERTASVYYLDGTGG